MNDDEILPFCMRCFSISAVPVDRVNFCHNCGGNGTCVNMKLGEIKYLQENIQSITGIPVGLIPIDDVTEFIGNFRDSLGINAPPSFTEVTESACKKVLSLVINSLNDYKKGEPLPSVARRHSDDSEQSEDNRFEGIL